MVAIGWSPLTLKGLSDLQTFMEVILEQGVGGDLMETGVYQADSCMLIPAVLQVYNDVSTKVWVLDAMRNMITASTHWLSLSPEGVPNGYTTLG